MSLRFLRKNQVEQFIHKRRALILQVYFSWYWKSIHASRWGIRSIDYGPKWQTYTPPKFAFATPKKRKQMVWLEFTLLLLFYPSPPLIEFYFLTYISILLYLDLITHISSSNISSPMVIIGVSFSPSLPINSKSWFTTPNFT